MICFLCEGCGTTTSKDPVPFMKSLLDCHICWRQGVHPVHSRPVLIGMKHFDGTPGQGATDSRFVMLKAVDFPDMSDVAVRLKIFPSKTQARKNGWSGPVVPKTIDLKKRGIVVTIQ